MFSTLDRYVIRSFLYCYLLVFLVCMGLRVVADLFVNMDEFSELDLSWVQMIAYVSGYYFYQTLVYFRELGGVILVAAAGFTLAWMNHTNELTAILASGVSLPRVIAPLLIVAVLLSGFSVVNQELLIPGFKQHLVRDRDEAPGKENQPIRMLRDGNRSIWWSNRYMLSTNELATPMVFLRDMRGMQVARLSGEMGSFVKPGTWRFSDAALAFTANRNAQSTRTVRTGISPRELAAEGATGADGRVRLLNQVELLAVSAERIGAEGVLARPRFEIYSDQVMGQPKGELALLAVIEADSAKADEASFDNPLGGTYALSGGRLLLISDMTPDEMMLRSRGHWFQYMSTSELDDLLATGKVPDFQSASLTRHLRFTQPLSILILLTIALPFILSRERNIKSSAAMAALVVGVCHLGSFLMQYFGGHGLDPVIAAWLPVLVFGPIAVLMVDAIKT